MTDQEFFNLLEKSLMYTPIVYKQSIFTTSQNNFDNKFRLEYKFSDIQADGLLFFVPSVSSGEGNCELIVSLPKKLGDSDNNFSYQDETYDIVVEQNDGTTRPATKGDIIAFRMCFFRFRKTQKQAVLCNSPLYNSAIFSQAKIIDCEFVNLPTIKDPLNESLTYTLVSSKDLDTIKTRLDKLESRIIFGTEDPEDALADKPTGTIYIQHEED
jgi:hypothetical protein